MRQELNEEGKRQSHRVVAGIGAMVASPKTRNVWSDSSACGGWYWRYSATRFRSRLVKMRKLPLVWGGARRPQVRNHRCKISGRAAKPLKAMVARDGVESPTPAFSGL